MKEETNKENLKEGSEKMLKNKGRKNEVGQAKEGGKKRSIRKEKREKSRERKRNSEGKEKGLRRVKEAKERKEKEWGRVTPPPSRIVRAGDGRGGGTPREVMGGAGRQCHSADGVFLGT